MRFALIAILLLFVVACQKNEQSPHTDISEVLVERKDFSWSTQGNNHQVDFVLKNDSANKIDGSITFEIKIDLKKILVADIETWLDRLAIKDHNDKGYTHAVNHTKYRYELADGFEKLMKERDVGSPYFSMLVSYLRDKKNVEVEDGIITLEKSPFDEEEWSMRFTRQVTLFSEHISEFTESVTIPSQYARYKSSLKPVSYQPKANKTQ